MKRVIRQLAVCALAVAQFATISPAAENPDDLAGQGPGISHVPVFTVARGQPVVIGATVTEKKAPVAKAVLYVKLFEVQKPIEYPMQAGESNLWQATIPGQVLLPVDHFWYHIEATDTLGAFTDTAWQPVNIVDALAKAGAAAAAAKGGSGGGIGGAAPWIIGGALVLGGGYAIYENNNDDGSGSKSPEPGPASPPTKKKSTSSNGGGDDTSPPPPPPCILTGGEQAFYDNLNPFEKFSTPIEIVVCGTCTNATVTAVGSWGEVDQITGYTNPRCVMGNPSLTLFLNKPESPPDVPESETISVFSNGQLIDSIPWPSSDFY